MFGIRFRESKLATEEKEQMAVFANMTKAAVDMAYTVV